MYFKRTGDTTATEASAVAKSKTIQEAHEQLGHMNEDMCRKTAKHLGWTIRSGNMNPCTGCTAAKARQKNVPKHTGEMSDNSTSEKTGRYYMDIATVRKPDELNVTVSKPVWHIIVDERTQLKFSFFYTSKNAMIEPTCEWLKKATNSQCPVKIIRMDNAGENKKLEARMQSVDWQMNIKVEYTARDTPQQNHLAELAFAVIANRGRAMMSKANIPMETRYRLYSEAFKTATLLDGLVITTLDGKSLTRYEHWDGKLPEFAKHLRTWGEAGTVKLRDLSTTKIEDRGVHCMMIGYAPNHAGDCYKMWNPRTGRVHETRDIIWLHRMFYQTPVNPKDMVIGPSVDFLIEEIGESNEVGESNETDERVETPNVETEDQSEMNNETTDQWTTVTRSGRASVMPERFRESASVSIDAVIDSINQNYFAALEECEDEETEEDEIESIRESLEFANVGAGLGGGFEHTSELKVLKYKEAMKSADKDKWDEAIFEEHERMLKHNVFKPTPIKDLPKDAKILSTTWALKKKAIGTYRARLTARGYEQEDGVHYDSTSKSAPVVLDATVRLVLILTILASWTTNIQDVNAAFLHGEFEPGTPPIYIYVPQGLERFYCAMAVVLLLLKTMYGTIQAALAFWRKSDIAFTNMEYKRSEADPCLRYKWTEHGLSLWTSHVDDNLNVGSEENVKKAKELMSQQFECSDQGPIQEYLGCKIDYDKRLRFMKITQPVLLQSFVDEFDLPEGQIPRTPAIPGSVLIRDEKDTLLDEEMAKKYRSGVGKLLYMVKSRPEIRNAVRELTRYMQEPTFRAMDAMHRAMKYCVGTSERGLILKPTGEWDGKDMNYLFELRGRADSDYAKDPTTRKSVGGYTTFLNDAPVVERSKMQKTVTLSVTEAEYIEASNCVQELLAHRRTLESIGLRIRLPMILEIDNKGAIDLSNNWNCGGRTRHIDVRHYFLRDLKEAGVIKIKWIATANNTADLFTKNLMGPLFDKHASVYCGVDEYMTMSVDPEGESVGGEMTDHKGSGSTLLDGTRFGERAAIRQAATDKGDKAGD